jgi:hypothetical protein
MGKRNQGLQKTKSTNCECLIKRHRRELIPVVGAEGKVDFER